MVPALRRGVVPPGRPVGTPRYTGVRVTASDEEPRQPKPGVTPLYKGEPLNAERGPGLGCFWFQVVLLGIFLILTPLTVVWRFEPWISATLLILTLVLLLFAGQTVIFLLRLVAADRRTRRRPQSGTARKTVGMLEDEEAASAGREDEPPH